MKTVIAEIQVPDDYVDEVMIIGYEARGQFGSDIYPFDFRIIDQPTNTAEGERDRFEAWAKQTAIDHNYAFQEGLLRKDSDGRYWQTWVDSAWLGFQAALKQSAPIAHSEPVAFTDKEVAAWCSRHDIDCNGAHLNAARCMMDDAASLRTSHPAALAEPIDIQAMIDRFLTWKLPKDFAPDAGISFERFAGEYSSPRHPDLPNWPTGTNLFTADQAKAMILHMLGDDA